MRKTLAVIALLIAVASGCSQSDGDRETNSGERDHDSGEFAVLSPLPVDEHSGADVVVAAFLDALRDGNDQIAEALLSDIAQQAVAEHGLEVRPPGSTSSTYSLGKVRRAHDRAHVECTWTEPKPGGGVETYDITWIVRKQSNGWRVSGMSTATDPSNPPILLNFEDMPDLLAKWQQVDEELAAQAEQPAALHAKDDGESLRR